MLSEEERKEKCIDTDQNRILGHRTSHDDVCLCTDHNLQTVLRRLMNPKQRKRILAVMLPCFLFGCIGLVRYSLWALSAWLLCLCIYAVVPARLLKKAQRNDSQSGKAEGLSEGMRAVLFFGMILAVLLPAFFLILAMDDLFLVLYTLSLIVGLAVPASIFCFWCGTGSGENREEETQRGDNA